MSARRSKVRAVLKRREQLARELAALFTSKTCGGSVAQSRTSTGRALVGMGEDYFERFRTDILAGHHFNAHAAREHARSLVRAYANNDHARNRCKLGLRLLEALKGQPSECRACVASGLQPSWDPYLGPAGTRPCNACNGTGHNLAGYLLGVVWSPAVRRRMREAYVYGARGSWLDSIPRNCLDGPDETRIAPRGEHRNDQGGSGVCIYPMAVWYGRPPWREGTGYWGQRHERDAHNLPRWRRGELRNEARRREQEQVYGEASAPAFRNEVVACEFP